MRARWWLTAVAAVALTAAGPIVGTGEPASAQANPLPALDWGTNTAGQLGVGTTTGPQQCGTETPGIPCSTTPVVPHLPGSANVASVAGGEAFGLALTTQGGVYAWGKNDLGQLGIGEATGPQQCGKAPDIVPCSTTPVQVHLPSGVRVTAISSSSDFSFALTNTGSVYAWGANESGQLGVGTHTGPDVCDDQHPCSTTPVLVQLPAFAPRIVAIAAGQTHGLAVNAGGAVLAWGAGDLGQLGDGAATEQDTPVTAQLPFGAFATSVATAGSYSLARLSDGTLLAWGNNVSGQLGVGESTGPDQCLTNPSVPCSKTPVAVHLPAGTFVTAIAGTFEGGLALTDRGTVLAWGSNTAGQLGVGTNEGPDSCAGLACSTLPVQVHLPAGVFVLALAGGFEHVLAETSSHNALAWGSNGGGELGIGTSTGPEKCVSGAIFVFCSTTPVVVLGPGGTASLGNVNAIAAGGDLSLAVTGAIPPAAPGAPLATSPQFGVTNQTDVFSVTNNGAVTVRWVRGSGAWQGPLAISGPGLVPPGAHLAASAQFGVPNQTDLFVVDNNGAIDVLWVQGAGTWHGPMAITPKALAPAGAPLATSQQFGLANQTDVFVVDNNGATRVSWVQAGGAWKGPMAITPAGLSPKGAHLAASQQFGLANQTDVFVVDNNGTTRVSWVQAGGAWKGPMGITPSGLAPAGAALATSPQFGVPNQTDVFVVATNGATRVSWVQAGGAWKGPMAITPAGLSPKGAHLAASQQFGVPNQTDVFVVANDGATQVSWVQGAGVWKGPMGITPRNLSPAAAHLAASQQLGIPNQTDVFVVANDGLPRVSWVQGAGAWNGPLAI